MRRAGTTKADEQARHERLIARIARRPVTGKLQKCLQAVAELWRPPEHLHSCLGGRVHWRIGPSEGDVAAVAEHHGDERADVRRLVFAALANTALRTPTVVSAVAVGLKDRDPVVRIHAARAAAALSLGSTSIESLAAGLVDPVWTVRWHCARALASTRLRGVAATALQVSRPEGRDHHLEVWLACAQPFAGCIDPRATIAPGENSLVGGLQPAPPDAPLELHGSKR